MRGVEIAERQIKVKTLQNCNTKALLASVGHFVEKFILGLQYRGRGARGVGGAGGAGRAGESGGDEGSRENYGTILFLMPHAPCPMPHNK